MGNPILTMIYRPDDFPPEYVAAAQRVAQDNYAAVAEQAGFDFRMIPVNELLPTCTGRPRLWYRGEDLLETPQCFQVDDFSWDPQASHFLAAVRRTIEQSDSVLVNTPSGVPSHVFTDKLTMMQRAAAIGVPAPATIAVPFGRYARNAVAAAQAALGPGPFIVKPREMGMGFGVLRVESVEQLTATVDLVAQSGIGYIVQQFLPNDGDLRTYVVNGSVVASQHRTPKAGHYLANLSQGGSSVPATAARDVETLSATVAGDLGAPYMMVDWLLTADGPVLNEWSSGFGGFDGLPEPERGRVADAFFDWAREELSSAVRAGGAVVTA